MRRLIGLFALMFALASSAPAAFAAGSSAALEDARAALRLKNYAKAREVLVTAARANDAEAQYVLASMYRNGVGIEQDLGQARRWLEAAAQQNHAAAQYSLATSLTTEEPRDLVAGKEWLQRAAAGGHRLAQQTRARNALPLQFEVVRDLTDREARIEALLAAVGRDDVATLTAFPDEEIRSAADDFGRGALAYAANACAMQTAKGLASRGVAVNQADRFGTTPLMLAAKCPTSGVLETLLTAKASVNARDSMGNTALAYAARAKRAAAVERLLFAGADVRATNVQGWSALDWSLRAQADDIARELRARGATSLVRPATSVGVSTGPFIRAPAPLPDLYRGWPDLLIASARQSPAQLQFLLQSGVDPNVASAEGYTPLVVATFTNHAANVDALLSDGATLAGSRAAVDPVRMSFRYGSDDLVQVLLASRNAARQLETDSEPRLVLAVRARRARAISTLLDEHVEVDQRGRNGVTALMLAAQTVQQEVVLQLLGAGARADLTDAAGRTALWYAAQAGAVECIPPLAAATPAEEAADQSPLNIAAANGRVDVVAALLRSGVKPVAKTVMPLAVAAGRGHVEVITALLDAGAPIDAQDRFGDTALIIAVRAGQLPAARALLAAGAKKSLRNQDRANARDVAAALGFVDLLTMLEK